MNSTGKNQSFTDLDKPYALSADAIEQYQKDGVIKLKEVLSPNWVSEMNEVVTASVLKLYDPRKAFDEAPSQTYARAFQQVMNLWTKSEEVKRHVFSKRLARIATELMRVDGVRLYHDQALYKAPHGGHTPWHADQYYWPLSNKNTCTVWIPLQAVSLDMGPLAFAKGSHLGKVSAEDAITEESDGLISKKIEGMPYLCEPFDLGEVSFHSGSLYHNAGENKSAQARKVMTVIYMDKDMKMVEPVNENQKSDAENWLPGIVPGQLCRSELNPILYDRSLDEGKGC